MGKIVKRRKNNQSGKSWLDNIIGDRSLAVKITNGGGKNSFEVLLGKINVFKK